MDGSTEPCSLPRHPSVPWQGPSSMGHGSHFHSCLACHKQSASQRRGSSRGSISICSPSAPPLYRPQRDPLGWPGVAGMSRSLSLAAEAGPQAPARPQPALRLVETCSLSLRTSPTARRQQGPLSAFAGTDQLSPQLLTDKSAQHFLAG